MSEFFDSVSSIFSWFSTIEILDMSLTTWIIIMLVLSAIALFIRGNK